MPANKQATLVLHKAFFRFRARVVIQNETVVCFSSKHRHTRNGFVIPRQRAFYEMRNVMRGIPRIAHDLQAQNFPCRTFLKRCDRGTAVEKALWFYCSVQEIVRSSISMSYPEDAERSVSASNSIRAVGMTGYQYLTTSYKSFQSGLKFVMSSSFLTREYFFNCFSRSIASSIDEKVS